MKTKYTLQELKDKKIAIRCDSQEESDKVKQFAINGGEKVNGVFSWIKDNPFFQTDPNNGVFGFFCDAFYNYSSLPASEFFLEDEPEVKEPELNLTQCVHLSAENAQDLLSETHYEYAVLKNATESAKKQIAEFEQVLAQIKIDAMKLGSRDLARLIKALKEI